MLDAFNALLEARDPALGRFRSYRLEAGTDLFGTWLVEVEYGRAGARGRRLRYVAGGADEARELVRKTLRRRATARKRIGVSYGFRELADPWGVGHGDGGAGRGVALTAPLPLADAFLPVARRRVTPLPLTASRQRDGING